MIAQSPNRLLAALPADEYRRLMPELHAIHLHDGERLPHCGETRVYFPEHGICSIRTVMADGRGIEIASVGNEGVVGLCAMSGLPGSPANVYVQVAEGSARFMLLGGLNRELARSATLRRFVERFSRGLLESIIQAAACNRLHTIEHRCARWLLTAQDLIGGPQFELTREGLADAIAVKKSKLAIVLKQLERRNLLDMTGGMVTIGDRPALERLACHCYGRIRRQREDALPQGSGTRCTGRANVIQLVPDTTCARCHSGANLPHQTEHECIVAIDAEMRVLVARTTKLHALRKSLVDERLRAMREYLDNVRTRFSF